MLPVKGGDMGKYKVVERFVSVNGEGKRAGQLAYFVRFAGCNLDCDYCDTKWANDEKVEYFEYDEKTLYTMIKHSNIQNVTLTGGEPLLQKDFKELLDLLRRDENLNVEIETNGSIDIRPFLPDSDVFAEKIYHRAGETFGMTLEDMFSLEEKAKKQDDYMVDNITFTLDYKLDVSGMEDKMFLQNFDNVRQSDTVKFVVGSRADLSKSLEIINEYRLVEKGVGVYLSPCFGKIEPAVIVDFMKEKKMNGVNVQLQLQKYIWSPDQKGV